MFPVICNAAFFERTQNQFLQLELWQKQPDNTERLIGTTNLPLHQFYVAFRDPKVMQHLSRVKVCETIARRYSSAELNRMRFAHSYR